MHSSWFFHFSFLKMTKRTYAKLGTFSNTYQLNSSSSGEHPKREQCTSTIPSESTMDFLGSSRA